MQHRYFPSLDDPWEVFNANPVESLTNSRNHTMLTQFKDLVSGQHVEANLNLANTFFASAERLAALNLHAARTLVGQSSANFKALLGVKDVQSLIGLQVAQAQPAMEQAVAYSLGLYEIANEFKTEIAKTVEGQMADAKAQVSGIVDKALNNAPAGSESAVAGIRTAMGAASSAYDSMNQVAKRVSDMAEAQVSAASQAGLKAAANISQMAKKAA